MRKITLKDIGIALNKSAATVSKALSNSPEISEETKRLVWDYANKHNFRFNTIARTLRKGQSKIIGLILPYINTPFFSELVGQVETQVTLLGYNLIVMQSSKNPVKELDCIESCLTKGVDGLIISSLGRNPSLACLQRLSCDRFPVVNIESIYSQIDCGIVETSWGDLQQTRVCQLAEVISKIAIDQLDKLLTR